MQDYHAELDKYLREEQFFNEDGTFNEDLLVRPPARPRNYKPPRQPDRNALFQPIWAHPKYGDRLDEGMVRRAVEAVKYEAEREGRDPSEFPGDPAPLPPRVWVLFGGDSSERQSSLASGVAAWLQLRSQADLQVLDAILFSSVGDSAGHV